MSAPDAPDFDEERIIRVLDQHKVDYVLVGGLGAFFHGATRPTMDFDMRASWELANLGRLADALNELAAQLKVRDLPLHMQLPKADAHLLHESVVPGERPPVTSTSSWASPPTRNQTWSASKRCAAGPNGLR